jgi:hypothetical protein
MKEFLSKIENFLFDILGLVLPGIIFLLLFISPISFLSYSKIPEKVISGSFILSTLITSFNILKTYWNENLNITLFILLVISYILGHTIKVFSIIVYDFLVALFDKTFNLIVVYLFNRVIFILNSVSKFLTNRDFDKTSFYKRIRVLVAPIGNTISKIFTFTSPSYFEANESMKTNCVTLLNQRLNTNYPDVWHSVYKLSKVIQQQEEIKTLSDNFLAKYNLYRSLSFVFILTTAYYFYFFRVSINYLSPELAKIIPLILYASIILWFTFHYKYKRYWTLCGNETLVSLFYFLNKKQINEV